MPKFAIPYLMEPDYPRQAGADCAPPMMQDFAVPGLMHIQNPNADLYATMEPCGNPETTTPFIVDMFDFLFYGNDNVPFAFAG